MSKLFLISAGHTNVAGQDRGAAGSGYVEGVEAVIIRDALAAAMRARGCQVIEDGSDGVSEPLKKAIALARQADVAIEIHFNAGPPKATGIEVLAKARHKTLAQSIGKAIMDATLLPLRGVHGWKSDSSGQHHRLGFCEAGGLIVEMCFISNASDMAAYKNNFNTVIDNLAVALTGIGSAAVASPDSNASSGVLPNDTTNKATQVTPSEPAAQSPILKRGSKGKYVVNLQRALVALGYSLKADGLFQEETESIVKRFQQSVGLTEDGIVGAKTWAKLDL